LNYRLKRRSVACICKLPIWNGLWLSTVTCSASGRWAGRARRRGFRPWGERRCISCLQNTSAPGASRREPSGCTTWPSAFQADRRWHGCLGGWWHTVPPPGVVEAAQRPDRDGDRAAGREGFAGGGGWRLHPDGYGRVVLSHDPDGIDVELLMINEQGSTLHEGMEQR
jgi:hypothetical protein